MAKKSHGGAFIIRGHLYGSVVDVSYLSGSLGLPGIKWIDGETGDDGYLENGAGGVSSLL